MLRSIIHCAKNAFDEIGWGYALKDSYAFGFVTITERHRERELEEALAENITEVLRELRKQANRWECRLMIMLL